MPNKPTEMRFRRSDRHDHTGPTSQKADKGLQNGSCNRQACQRSGATWFNHGTSKYYCEDCARSINRANPDAHLIGLTGPLCVPQPVAETTGSPQTTGTESPSDVVI